MALILSILPMEVKRCMLEELLSEATDRGLQIRGLESITIDEAIVFMLSTLQAHDDNTNRPQITTPEPTSDVIEGQFDDAE